MLKLTNDIIHKLLEELEVNSIKQLCRVNHKFNQIYNNKNFWVNKFKRENLDISYIASAQTTGDFIFIYRFYHYYFQHTNDQRLIQSNEEAKDIINVAFMCKNSDYANIWIAVENDTLINTLKRISSDYGHNFKELPRYFCFKVEFSFNSILIYNIYHYEYGCDNYTTKFSINKEDILMFLTIILSSNQHGRIYNLGLFGFNDYDEGGISYLREDLDDNYDGDAYILGHYYRLNNRTLTSNDFINNDIMNKYFILGAWHASEFINKGNQLYI